MPVTAAQDAKNYTLGKGRVLIERYPAGATITETTRGDGERYIGNSPEFSTSSSSESLDHYDSDDGVKVKDASVQLSQDRTGSFTTDNVNDENLALLFLGVASSITQTAATGAVEQITGYRGRYLQLGSSPTNPTGVRKITNVVVKKGSGFATTVAPTGNYQVDEELGQVFVLKDAADITDNTDLQITYDVAASTRSQVVSSSNAIYGSLRFIAKNPIGPKKDYFFPYCKITPDGDFALKGDDWQTLGFTFEILKKGSLEAAYIDGRPATV